MAGEREPILLEGEEDTTPEIPEGIQDLQEQNAQEEELEEGEVRGTA